jgi:hypothetical protein
VSVVVTGLHDGKMKQSLLTALAITAFSVSSITTSPLTPSQGKVVDSSTNPAQRL